MRVWSWVRKDFGDHRPVLFGIAIAIPLLTLLAFWAFGEMARGASSETLGRLFAIGLLILLWFGVASDLVATDLRRDTMSAIRRTPGGLGCAWAGKLAFLVLAVGVLSAWTAASLQGAWELFGTQGGVVQTGPGLSEGFWLTVLMGAPLLSWPLLIGTWVGRSGAAGLGGLLVLGSVGAPVWLWWREHQYAFAAERPEVLQTVALYVGVAGFVLASVSFLFGHRHRGRAWRPFLVGGSALAVLLVAGFAWGSWKADRWTRVEPGDEDLLIYSARVADGGKKLWVSVYRGVPWGGGKPLHQTRPDEDNTGTLVQTWIVDVDARSVTRVHDGAEAIVGQQNFPYRQYAWNPGFLSLDPDVVLWTYTWDPDSPLKNRKIDRVTWWDGETSKAVATLAPELRNGATDALLQRALRASTPHRDSQGRRVWMRDGQFEREGEERESATRSYNTSQANDLAIVPGGWVSTWTRRFDRGRRLEYRIRRIDVEGLETTSASHLGMYPPRVLSLRHHITRRAAVDGKMRSGHVVRPFDDPTRELPLYVSGSVVGEDQVIVSRGDPKDGNLVLADPRTGEVRTLRWKGERPARVDHVRAEGRRSDGRVVLRLHWNGANFTGGSRFAVLDVVAGTVSLVGPPIGAESRPVALLEDGSVVVLEGSFGRRGYQSQRVARIGPGAEARTVMFPFAD